jgi:hypothetical protein
MGQNMNRKKNSTAEFQLLAEGQKIGRLEEILLLEVIEVLMPKSDDSFYRNLFNRRMESYI